MSIPACSDEKVQALIELKNQYDLIDESLLQQLQHEREIAEQQRQRAQQAREQARQQQQQSTNGGGSGAIGGTVKFEVEVKGAGGLNLDALANNELAEKVVRKLAPAMQSLARRGFGFPFVLNR